MGIHTFSTEELLNIENIKAQELNILQKDIIQLDQDIDALEAQNINF